MNDKLELLNRLRDIQQPDGLHIWPLAPGWWLLMLLLLASVAFGLMLLYRKRAMRRAALKELARLKRRFQTDANVTALAMGLSILLRRVALACDSRQQVAGLTGRDWLNYLDLKGKTRDFSIGPGRQLCTAPYGDASGMKPEALLSLVRRWIKLNI